MNNSKDFLRSDIASLQDQLALRKQQLLTLASEEQGFVWQQISDRLALLQDPQQRNGWSHTAYLGFATKRQAEQCAKALKRKALASQMVIRKARRLPNCKWEIKAIALEPEVLYHLAGTQTAAQTVA
jgi:hypothetical protein